MTALYIFFALQYAIGGALTVRWSARICRNEGERLGLADAVTAFLAWPFALGYVLGGEWLARRRLKRNFKEADRDA